MVRNDLMATVAAMQPTTKVGRLRALLPTIEQQMRSGVRIAELLVVLRAAGIDVSEATFKTYLHRYRRQKATKPDRCVPARERPATVPAAPARGEPSAEGASPVSLHALDELMKPDTHTQAIEMDRYEQLGRKSRRRQE